MFCGLGYTTGHAPRATSPGVGDYMCGHHVLLSHAKVYHLYKNNYSQLYGGKVGIALNTGHTWPNDPNSVADQMAADRAYQFSFGWFAQPIFGATGDYPEVMIGRVANNSAKEGRRKSRLPVFSAEEIASLRGSADFMGLNYYTSAKASDGGDQHIWTGHPSRDRDQNTRWHGDASWPVAESPWLRSVAEGLRELLK